MFAQYMYERFLFIEIRTIGSFIRSLGTVKVACHAMIMNFYFVPGVKKMTAKAAKTVKYGSSVDGISTAEPDQYSKRFLAFMADAIEGEGE